MSPTLCRPLSREERAEKAKVAISTHFDGKQRVFLDFVLSHHVSVAWRNSTKRS